MPINKNNYPDDWPAISAYVRKRAGNKCEGSPAYPGCRAVGGTLHPVTESRVVLTVGHMDHNPGSKDTSRMRCWCQRCHLTYDAPHHTATRWARRFENQQLLFT